MWRARLLSSYSKTLTVLLVALMFAPILVGATPVTWKAYGLDEVTAALTEWTIPTAGSLPSGLALDPSGNCCWFVESSGNRVTHLDPSTDTFQQWTIPTPNSNPTGLALTAISGSLAVFGTEAAKNKVFVFFPDTDTFKEYTLPSPDWSPQLVSIEPGATEIRAWFTALKGSRIGEIVYNPDSGTARFYEVTLPPAAGGGANDAYAGSGIIWLATSSAIVKLDRAVSQFTTWAIPYHPSTQAASIDVDALGQIWYTSTSPGTNYVGVLSDNTFTEWQVPTIAADARVISMNPVTGNPWFVEYQGDKIAKLDPSAGGIVTTSKPITARSDLIAGAIFTHVARPVLPSTTVVTPVASRPTMSITEQFTEWALAAGSAPYDVVADASGDVWILESSTNKIARLSLASDFLIECDPPSLIVPQSLNGTSTCTVTSIDGFSLPVELLGSWAGPEPTRVAYTLPTPITPPPGRTVSSTLIISAGARASTGTFTFQVTGTSGSLTHSANLEVTIAAGVADFALTASPSYLSIPSGAGRPPATSTITVQSLGVFFSPVDLTSSGVPDGMTLNFGTNPVTPPIAGTASSTVTVTVSGAQVGTYALTITGTSESLTHSTTLTVEVAGGGCLIATATYGSELADEVQFLRNFRDRSIMKTNAGLNFMTVFNAWYYSFSPSVAEFIHEHPAFGTAAKIALYPLIGILRIGASVFHLFPSNSEAGAVVSGLVVSSLVGLVYFAPPLTAVLVRSARARRVAKRVCMPAVAVLFGALASVGLTTILTGPAVVMMAATSTIVLASLIGSALFASQVILRTAGRL